MKNICSFVQLVKLFIAVASVSLIAACVHSPSTTDTATASSETVSSDAYEYKIGPGDTLDIFVWRNPDVSTKDVPVRPDGRVSAPLVDSLMASGKTPSQLAQDIETILAEYIRDPLVTVTVKTVRGGIDQLVRVIGEVTKPGAIPYSRNMTVLDVMLAVQGLTEFADGNKAKLVRAEGSEFIVRLDDLLKGGQVGANTDVLPGDILIVPESLF